MAIPHAAQELAVGGQTQQVVMRHKHCPLAARKRLTRLFVDTRLGGRQCEKDLAVDPWEEAEGLNELLA